MNHLFHSSRSDSERHLRERIFSVLPAASFHLDRLLQLLDIVESDRSPTACIECSTQPRLHINPRFLAEQCPQDEDLFLLVLHELYHVVLGHTRLFARITPLDNLVFDAVINAMLCHQFREGRYTQFFQRMNSWDSFPARLLRPPPGWPDHPEPLPSDASAAEVRVVELLYGNDTTTVTYLDVFNALKVSLAQSGDAISTIGVTLLGDHSGENQSGADDEAVLHDETLRQVFRKIVEGWPPPPKPIAGRDEGRTPEEFYLPPSDTAQSQFLQALGRLLRKAGILQPSSSYSTRAWRNSEQEREQWTVLPQSRDRRAAAWAQLTGARPVFYQAQTIQPRRVLGPQEVAHVYFDISGSMTELLPMLGQALDRPHRRGLARLHAFSTVVAAVDPRRPLAKQPIRNTGGTDINCVLDHLAALKPRETPRRVLLLTDGYTGQPRHEVMKELERRHVQFFVGLVGKNVSRELEPLAKLVEQLPWK